MTDYDPMHTFGHSAHVASSSTNVTHAYEQPASPRSPSFDSTPSTISSSTSLNTPPSSLRQYSTALKAMMAQGMSAAVADMNDDTREAERSFDKEFGYDDEDPIERHMRMSLTPCRIKMPTREDKPMSYTQFMDMTRAKEEKKRMEMEEVLVHEDEDNDMDEGESGKNFRPGLIQFHRTHSSARRGIPSFGSSMESGSRSGSSTPFGDETGTPGSEFSEASFEAIKPEDMYSLYGKPAAGYPFPRATVSHDTFGSVTPPKQDRMSVMSNSSTITSLSTMTAMCTATIVDARQARPSLVRPRPRATPYSGSYEGRQKEKEGAAMLQPPIDDDDLWMQGRTVSEQMVVQAGVRCQRGRGMQR